MGAELSDMVRCEFPLSSHDFVAHRGIESEMTPEIGSSPAGRFQKGEETFPKWTLQLPRRFFMLFLIGEDQVGQKLE